MITIKKIKGVRCRALKVGEQPCKGDRFPSGVIFLPHLKDFSGFREGCMPDHPRCLWRPISTKKVMPPISSQRRLKPVKAYTIAVQIKGQEYISTHALRRLRSEVVPMLKEYHECGRIIPVEIRSLSKYKRK